MAAHGWEIRNSYPVSEDFARTFIETWIAHQTNLIEDPAAKLDMRSPQPARVERWSARGVMAAIRRSSSRKSARPTYPRITAP